MRIDDPRRQKEFPILPITLTLKELSGDKEEYMVYMPDIPQYPSGVVETLVEGILDVGLPYGYDKVMGFKRDDAGDTVSVEITLPSFDHSSKHLWCRLDQFVKEELKIIQNGY